jgi:aspartate carbamoyltransferase catalytic subunit
MAADRASIPVINGGDGSGPTSEHPSQALIDMYTIQREKGTIDGLKVAIVGNLLHSRTPHSLAIGLSKYNCTLILSGPEGFEMPKEIIDCIRTGKAKVTQVPDLNEALQEADVLETDTFSWKPINDIPVSQRDRLISLVRMYRFVPETFTGTKADFIFLHSLPRSDEFGFQVDPAVDKMKCARYMQEAANGPRLRMALLNLILAG